MAEADRIRIGALSAAGYEAAIPGLAALLVDAVDGGASVNFLAGVDEATAAGWWRSRVAAVADGTISPFVAFDGERVVGSVLLIRSRNPNSPHRAEIAKVLTHRSARRRGIGTALMAAAETTPGPKDAGCSSSTPRPAAPQRPSIDRRAGARPARSPTTPC